MTDDFAALVLTHGRPERQITLRTLRRCGYTGRVVLVVDDGDDALPEYRRRYPGMVETFNKAEVARTFDLGDTSGDWRTIVFARNAAFDIAESLDVSHFVELDDDYTSFMHRWARDGRLLGTETRRLDDVFAEMCAWLDGSGALTVAFAQGGDYGSGAKGINYRRRCMRKAMNTFFCRTDRRFSFVGRINEDVNTYVTLGGRGGLLMSTTDFCITQVQTQAASGGMSDTYLDSGTYVKSFMTVMMAPSCVRLMEMGEHHKRIHHAVDWNRAVPKILGERWA